MCDKRFKTSDFVQKHIFNKHAEELDEKFSKPRFEDMLKDNYLEDPSKFINSFQGPNGGGFNGDGARGGYYGRDRNQGDRRFPASDRRRYDGGGGRDFEGGDRRPRKEYVDFDDPSLNAAVTGNPERQLVSYDDLF